MSNLDERTVAGFGDEWQRFDQTALPPAEAQKAFDDYFSIFPWDKLPKDAVGFDLGCGSGRWAKLAAPRVGTLHAVDPSAEALASARKNLANAPNAVFHNAAADALPFADGSMDFGYSLGVLHHIPNTAQAMADAARKLKPGAPFLVYLYYSFENRPAWFRAVWKASELGRNVIARLPHGARYVASQAIAASVYFPFARGAKLLEKAGLPVGQVPLSAYRHRSFYQMRTDALDRFGTALEQRFSRAEITEMMLAAGLRDVRFRDEAPFWCAVGYKT